MRKDKKNTSLMMDIKTYMMYISIINIINDILMEISGVKALTGIILSSANPQRLAIFYRDVLGIPMALNQHGNTPQHWECDFRGIHYAVLKSHSENPVNANTVLSFGVPDISDFVATHHIELIHPVMDLGEGASIASFKDPDGNTLRLWMLKKS